MIKQTVTHPYHGILLRSKKEQTIDGSNDLDESLENYVG